MSHPNRRQGRAHAAQPPQPAMRLRIGVHNVRGMWLLADEGQALVNLQRFMAEWAKQRLDIIIVTETHALTSSDEESLTQRLTLLGQANPGWSWTAYWARPNALSSGVAFLFRTSLLEQRALVLQPVAVPVSLPAELGSSGRLQALTVAWGGHRLQLLGAYLPSGSSAEARSSRLTYIQQALPAYATVAAAAGHMPLWGGDWNFVPNPALDRHRSAPTGLPAPALSDPHGVAFAAALPGVVDVYRHMHAAGRAYTFVRPPTAQRVMQASRLDRFYTHPHLLPHISSCGVPSSVLVGRTDHRLVVLELLARVPPTRGAGLPRARTGYLRCADLRLAMETWLAQQRDAMPTDHAALLAWYPGFKAAWMQRLRAVNASARHRVLDALAGSAEARSALDVAEAAVLRGDPGSEVALSAATAAHEASVTSAARASVTCTRHSWVHTREAPSPLLTRLVKPPASATAIPGLHSQQHGGSTVTALRVMPGVMAAHWAGICSPPPPAPAARQAVMAAVHACAGRMEQGPAAAAGSASMRAAEVKAAVKRLKPGTAPGPDGLPVAVMRPHLGPVSAILARVFSAVGALQTTPPDFLLGAITFFYKSGDRADPANYRPITLLGADYRVLARVLATRLGPVMAPAINRAQTAFLPGRRMGEAVWLLQLLPGWLRSKGESAALAFLDFAKAYDTVDRPFLLSVMDAMGAGPGLLSWVRILLGDTRAMALVNGFLSPPTLFTAGVRQGCPLSPLLYLFVGEALLAWLSHRGHGIDIPGAGRLAGTQYADDFTAILRTLAGSVPLAADLDTFGDASGQRPNLTKTQLLPIGVVIAAPTQPPPFPIVQHAHTLGLSFCNGDLSDEALTAFWQDRMQRVYDRYDKLSRLPLSMFGRAYGASGYGLSRLLFHMEFMGLPPHDQLVELVRHTAALVDGAVSPLRTVGRRLTGISRTSMAGTPGEGGCGLLPLQQHVQARHAWWGLQLVTAPLRPEAPAPWLCVARALLAAVAPAATPLCLLTSRSSEQVPSVLATAPRHGPRPSFPYPLTHATTVGGRAFGRLVSSLHPFSLACPQSASVPVLGSWCAAAPVWGNPLLTYSTVRLGIEWFFPLLFQHWLLPTLDAARAFASLFPMWTWYAPERQSALTLARHRDELVRLWAMLPQAWKAHGHSLHAAGQTMPLAAAHAQVRILSSLVIPVAVPDAPLPVQPGLWAYLLQERPKLLLTDTFTVRMLTSMQRDNALADRWARLQAFLADATAPPAFTIPAFLARLQDLWALPWDNRFKEPMWRLALDGLAIYGSSRYRAPHPALACHCGGGPVGRIHCFWDCCVAQAVHRSVQAALEAWDPSSPQLQRHQLWLAEPPLRLHGGVWQVVALAALCAINVGRKRLVGACLDAQGVVVGPRQRPCDVTALPLASFPHLVQACVHAEERFWALIADFVGLAQDTPKRWRSLYGSVPASHPFMHGISQGRLSLSPRPAPTALVALPPGPLALPAPLT
jgi:exonuclease III